MIQRAGDVPPGILLGNHLGLSLLHCIFSLAPTEPNSHASTKSHPRTRAGSVQGAPTEARYLGRYLPLSDSDKTDDLDDSEEGLTRQLKKLISQRKAPNVQLNAIKELMKRKYGKVTQKQADQIDIHTAQRLCDLADRLVKPA